MPSRKGINNNRTMEQTQNTDGQQPATFEEVKAAMEKLYELAARYDGDFMAVSMLVDPSDTSKTHGFAHIVDSSMRKDFQRAMKWNAAAAFMAHADMAIRGHEDCVKQGMLIYLDTWAHACAKSKDNALADAPETEKQENVKMEGGEA